VKTINDIGFCLPFLPQQPESQLKTGQYDTLMPKVKLRICEYASIWQKKACGTGFEHKGDVFE